MEMCTNCRRAPYRPLTQSAAGSPVNLFRTRANGKVRTITGGCGQSSPVWWMAFDPDTSSWRTCQGSTHLEVPKSSLILPRWAMTRSGVVYLRKPLGLPTAEKGSSLWPTPTARDHKDSGENVNWENLAKKSRLAGTVNMEERRMWPTVVARDYENPCPPNWHGSRGTHLKDEVQLQPEKWPTPTATDAVGRGYMRNGDKGFFSLPGAVGAARIPEEMEQERLRKWPTPNARDWKGPLGQGASVLEASSPEGGDPSSPNSTTPNGTRTRPSHLNPAWVEWLMGYPIGWTEFDPWATLLSPTYSSTLDDR